MLKMVDGSGIIGVDMICPLGISTPQPPNYDRVELEGAGMLVLPNSLDAPLERFELSGKTDQVQTSGKQLFDASRYEGVTKNGVTVTVKDGVITATGTANINTWIQIFVSKENYQKLFKPENKIYLKANKSKDCNYDFGLYGSFGSPIVGTIREGNSGKELPAELPRNDTDFYFFIDVKNGVELKGSIKPIVYHDGDGTWEPYTGGKPSPSPEYPQEIKNVGKWNEETQKYEIDVKVTGRNLFNGKLSKGKFITDDMNVVSDLATMNTFDKPVEIEPNTDYVISANGVIWEGNINVYDENGKKIVQHFTGKFKTPSNAKYIRASISNARAPIDSKIQMEYGTAMNEFEQYHQPQVLTLTSDRPITKWDKLVEQGGEIGWLYQSNTVVIDGSETWSSSNVPEHIYFTTVVNNKSGRINTSLCKTYKNNGEPVFNKKHEGKYNIYSDHPTNGVSDTAFVPPNETVTTIPQWKEWLNANPIEMLYKTKTTEFVPLPQSEQNAIRALKTYYPTTVITADGGELDPDIKVTYRKEI